MQQRDVWQRQALWTDFFSAHRRRSPMPPTGLMLTTPFAIATAVNSEEEQSSKYSSAFCLRFATWSQVGKSSTLATWIYTACHQYSISLQPRGNCAETRLRLDAAQTPLLCHNLIQAIFLLRIKAQILPYKIGMKPLIRPHLNKYYLWLHKSTCP